MDVACGSWAVAREGELQFTSCARWKDTETHLRFNETMLCLCLMYVQRACQPEIDVDEDDENEKEETVKCLHTTLAAANSDD